MTAPTTISVIMVTYYTGPGLARALEGALNQGPGIELILVNNGNPPELERALIRRFKDDPHVRLMTGHGNIGPARGLNLGARVAQGDYLLFISPDNVLPDGAATYLRQEAANLKRPFMIGARLLDAQRRESKDGRRALLTPRTALVEGLGLGRIFPRSRLYLREEALPEAVAPVPAVGGGFMFMPTVDFSLLRGFDEGYAEAAQDHDLCWRFRRAGGEIYFTPFLNVPRAGASARRPAAAEKQAAKDYVRYFRQNFGKNKFSPSLWLLEKAIWIRFTLRAFLYPFRKRAA